MHIAELQDGILLVDNTKLSITRLAWQRTINVQIAKMQRHETMLRLID